MGDRRWETDDGRQKIGDERQETRDGRWETGDKRPETRDGRQKTGTGDEIHDTGRGTVDRTVAPEAENRRQGMGRLTGDRTGDRMGDKRRETGQWYRRQ